MRTSSELKRMARQALCGNYGTVIGAQMLSMLVCMLPLIPFYVVLIFVEIAGAGNDSVIFVMLPLGIILFLAYIVVAMGTMSGYMRICYQIARGETTVIGDLMYGWKHRFLRFLGLFLIVWLWIILAWLPGIVVMCVSFRLGNDFVGIVIGYLLGIAFSVFILCRYVLALYALVEDPQMGAREALRFSKELLSGNRWRMLKLEFSFIGVGLLGYLSLGIGFLWVMPYLLCTNALFYQALKEGH